MKQFKTTSLDNLDYIKKIDTGRVLDSIDLFFNQAFNVLDDARLLSFPTITHPINNVVVAGMGGSAFAPEIVKTMFSQEILVPYEINREYHLPGYVGANSLVIISSYSGTTKEAIACANEALTKGSQIIAIFSRRQQNELYKLAVAKKIPSYIFEEKYNPSLQPRLGEGYMVVGHVVILIKTGLLRLSLDKVRQSLDLVRSVNQFSASVPIANNPAKKMALQLFKRFPILVCSEFLQGAIHGFANQLNETSKTHSAYHFIPEINHHRMEGLEFPQAFKQLGVFVLYPSSLYDKRVQARYKLTKKIIQASGFPVIEYVFATQSKIAQVFEAIVFNSYLSFYLAMLYQKNPVEIPWVDKFKEKMAVYEK